MALFDVADLSALEILDSRGRPTLAVTVRLADGTTARAGVPSGASTGRGKRWNAATATRPGTRARGCWARCRPSTPRSRDLLRGRSWASLAEADQAMIDLDGTPNKSRLGANATVGSLDGARPRAGRLGRDCRCGSGSPRRASRRRCRCRTSTCSTAACTRRTRWTSRSSWSPRSARPSMAEAVRAGAEVYSALRRELSEPQAVHRAGRRGRLRPRGHRAGRGPAAAGRRPSPTPATRRAPTACPSRWTWPPRSSASQTAATGSPATCCPAAT